jgi:trehalose 6-phosphate phosphatase
MVSTSPITSPDSTDIDHLAEVTELLVALDFDGTLAEFSTDPLEVRMVPGARESIDRLTACTGTTVMLLSGRNLEILQPVAEVTAVADPSPGDILLVGSHGAEPADTSATANGLSEEKRTLLTTLGELAETFATRDPGVSVEYKPFAVGLHIRGAEDRRVGLTAYEEFRLAAQQLEGATVTPGKDIVEVSVSAVTKGSYLQAYMRRTGPDAVLFIGDDVTDETAQRVLNQGESGSARPDVGVRVGEGDTAAHRRLEDPTAVAAFLADLASARESAQGVRS